jgi:hypothetical protein
MKQLTPKCTYAHLNARKEAGKACVKKVKHAQLTHEFTRVAEVPALAL